MDKEFLDKVYNYLKSDLQDREKTKGLDKFLEIAKMSLDKLYIAYNVILS